MYTSFSGSHQDAIRKAFAARKDDDVWDMPYLPIDPKDLGRGYDAVIRVNSQSGKGGITYLLESEYGLELPRRLQIEFSQVVQAVMDGEGKELAAMDIWRIFAHEYAIDDATRVNVAHPSISEQPGDALRLAADVTIARQPLRVEGRGTGPIDAFVDGLARQTGTRIRVLDYHEHSIGSGADARAVAYLELRIGESGEGGQTRFGVGIDTNIVSASLKAIASAVNRAHGLSFAAERDTSVA